MDYLVKTFMRIIFKSIHIHNQEIVKVELNEPWKTCYNEGVKICHSEPKAKNLNEGEILRSVCSLPQDDGNQEGMKWLKTQETTQILAKPQVKSKRNYVCFCVPSDVRWPAYRRTMQFLAEALLGE